jgi:hypothetical protein
MVDIISLWKKGYSDVTVLVHWIVGERLQSGEGKVQASTRFPAHVKSLQSQVTNLFKSCEPDDISSVSRDLLGKKYLFW